MLRDRHTKVISSVILSCPKIQKGQPDQDILDSNHFDLSADFAVTKLLTLRLAFRQHYALFVYESYQRQLSLPAGSTQDG